MNTRGNNGLVVGPQGSNVKRIEDETGARVKCLKDKTTVEIYGSPEAVRRATTDTIDGRHRAGLRRGATTTATAIDVMTVTIPVDHRRREMTSRGTS